MTYYRIPNGTRVECYWNLHKHCYSIRVNGRVVAHRACISVEDVTLAVQPAGRERARREGRKNVHAFVRGTWNEDWVPERADICVLAYNPHQADTFMTTTNRAVTRCTRVVGLTREGGHPVLFGIEAA